MPLTDLRLSSLTSAQVHLVHHQLRIATHTHDHISHCEIQISPYL